MSSNDNLRLSAVPTVHASMGIRRPPDDVCEALVDPAITSKYWIATGSGRLEPGTTVQWEMDTDGAMAEVKTKTLEQGRRLVFDWGGAGEFTTVNFRFEPWGPDKTHVTVSESGLSGTGDELLARAADSTGGFTMVLCALKALLEHDIELRAVCDRNAAS